MRRFLIFLLLTLTGMAHAISYTVQVAAVSDQDSALSLVRQLLRDDYPAYFVRTTTDTGFVFRIRVGAFDNRSAAVAYAEAMPSIAGARPIPALAEAIPAGIMPFTPRLLLTADLGGVKAEILPWNGSVVFRMQSIEPLEEAVYYLLDASEPLPFRAWNATPEEDGSILRVRNLPLWPDAAEEDTEEVRAEFAVQLRRLIASQLGLEAAAVHEAVFETADGSPALIVVERFRLGATDSGELVGLADPSEGLTAYGPTAYVSGAGLAPVPPEPVATLSRDPEADPEAEMQPPESVSGGPWTAQSDE